jgi:hypothetical protein
MDPQTRTFFFFSQNVHGKCFQKGYDRGKEHSVKDGDGQHGPKINAKKIQHPDQGTAETT